MKRLTPLLLLLLFALSALLSGGCGPGTETLTIKLESDPEGASVSLISRGQVTELGKTPMQLNLPVGTQGLLCFEAEGYEKTWLPFAPVQDSVHRGELKRQEGSVLLLSRPSNAQVFQNGQMLGETPLVLTRLPLGTHQLELAKPGFASIPVTCELTDDVPKLLRGEIETNLGTVTFSGMPEDAQVFLNDTEIGTTPYTGDLTEGAYTVRIHKEGFGDFVETIVVKRNEVQERSYQLAAQPGQLELISDPDGASVFINGELRGTTPLKLDNLQPGTYQLELSKAGFAMEATPFTIASGQMTRLNGKLVLSTGGFDLDVEPNGVAIYLDGKELGLSSGETFKVRELEPGKHVLRVAHKYADPQLQDFPLEIRKGEVLRLPVLKIWVANSKITMRRDGEVLIGVIEESSENGPVRFSPSRGIRTLIEREKIESIAPLE